MIIHLKHHEIDFDKWDDCVNRSINGIIYAYSFYLNQVSPEWEALIEKDYKSIMPLPVKKKAGISYIMQPVFVQQLGVFSPHLPDESLIQQYMNKIPSKYRFIHYHLNTFNNLDSLPKGRIFKSTNYELDLIASYDLIFKNFSSNTKRNLKKSQKKKVFIVKNSNPEPVIESFRTYRGKAIKVMGNEQYNTLKHLIYSGIHRGNTIVYSAYTAENNYCAGIVFMHSHQKSILIFSGTTPEAKKNGAMTAIIDTYIREHSGTNTILDFEGSNDKQLARFYAGFGSKECVFLQIRINRFPILLNFIVNTYLSSRKKLAGY